MKELFLIRHGETSWNHRKVLMGQADIPLNEEGIKQAKIVASNLNKIKFEAIYSSDLTRAYSTAQAINKFQKLNISVTPLIREINFGKFRGQSTEIINQVYKLDSSNFYHDPNFKPENGESHTEFLSRISLFLENISQKPEKKIAVVCHGGVIRGVISLIRSLEKEQEPKLLNREFKIKNCSVSKIQYEKGLWKIKEINQDSALLSDARVT